MRGSPEMIRRILAPSGLNEKQITQIIGIWGLPQAERDAVISGLEGNWFAYDTGRTTNPISGDAKPSELNPSGLQSRGEAGMLAKGSWRGIPHAPRLWCIQINGVTHSFASKKEAREFATQSGVSTDALSVALDTYDDDRRRYADTDDLKAGRREKANKGYDLATWKRLFASLTKKQRRLVRKMLGTTAKVQPKPVVKASGDSWDRDFAQTLADFEARWANP